MQRILREGSMVLGMLVLLAHASACDVDRDDGTVIGRTRVIGARVEVAGEPLRASPRPGEAATVTWLVTAPAETPPLGWAFVLCLGPDRGHDGCSGPELGVFSGGAQPGSGNNPAPTVTFTVPAAADLAGASELTIYGRICDASAPVIGADGRPACTGGGEGTTAFVSVPLDLGGAGNHNPSFATTPLSFDDQPWGRAAICAELPQVVAGSKDHGLGLVAASLVRERYTALRGDPAQPVELREALQISQFITAGKLERGFSSVEGDASDDAPVAVKWDAPGADAIPAGGLVVRFTFVVRDGRGGIDWTDRAVCVVR